MCPENDERDLGEMDSEEEFIFPLAERRIITQPYDLSIQTLVEQWNGQILILPEIQRQYVWDDGKASRLIESLLLNIPIPVLYFAETSDAKYEVIDGHQRVRSVARYVGNEFRLSGLGLLREYRGARFHQLPEREQRFLKTRTLRAIVISVDSHPRMKFEVFERLNTGAVSLNAQELRNSMYRGPFNRLLHDLARNLDLRSIIGSKSPRPRMVDEELILRFFALRQGLDQYRPPLKGFLNDYMDERKDLGELELTDLRVLLASTVGRIRALVGENAFRITGPDGETTERVVNRALYDAQMLVASWTEEADSGSHRPQILAGLSNLYTSTDFLDTIQRATGDRSRTLRRIRDVEQVFEAAGLTVTVPFDLTE